MYVAVHLDETSCNSACCGKSNCFWRDLCSLEARKLLLKWPTHFLAAVVTLEISIFWVQIWHLPAELLKKIAIIFVPHHNTAHSCDGIVTYTHVHKRFTSETCVVMFESDWNPVWNFIWTILSYLFSRSNWAIKLWQTASAKNMQI